MNKKLLLTLLISSALVGCGGSGGSGGSGGDGGSGSGDGGSGSGDSGSSGDGASIGTLFSGKVLGELEPVATSAVTSARSSSDNAVQSGDYLENALVFVDLNYNGVLDSGEPSARTDSNGSYTMKIENSKRICGLNSPVLAVVKNSEYEYTMSVTPNYSRAGGYIDNMDITPVTTKVWDLATYKLDNSSFSCEDVSGSNSSILTNAVDAAELEIAEEIYPSMSQEEQANSILSLYSDYSVVSLPEVEEKSLKYMKDVAEKEIAKNDVNTPDGTVFVYGKGKIFEKYNLDASFDETDMILIVSESNHTEGRSHKRLNEVLLEDVGALGYNAITANTVERYVDILTLTASSNKYEIKYTGELRDAIVARSGVGTGNKYDCSVKETYLGNANGENVVAVNKLEVPQSNADNMVVISECHYTYITDDLLGGGFNSVISVTKPDVLVEESIVSQYNQEEPFLTVNLFNVDSRQMPTDEEIQTAVIALSDEIEVDFTDRFSSSTTPDSWNKNRVEYNICPEIELIRYSVYDYGGWTKKIVTTGIEEYLLSPPNGTIIDESWDWSDPLNWEHALPNAPTVCGH